MGKMTELTGKINDILEDMAKEFCDNYCKWPEQWDEDAEGVELWDSDICKECPFVKYL